MWLFCSALGSLKEAALLQKTWGKMEQLSKDGHFDWENFDSGPSMSSSPGDTHCAAVSASTREMHCRICCCMVIPQNKIFEGKVISLHGPMECLLNTIEACCAISV